MATVDYQIEMKPVDVEAFGERMASAFRDTAYSVCASGIAICTFNIWSCAVQLADLEIREHMAKRKRIRRRRAMARLDEALQANENALLDGSAWLERFQLENVGRALVALGQVM